MKLVIWFYGRILRKAWAVYLCNREVLRKMATNIILIIIKRTVKTSTKHNDERGLVVFVTY